MTANWGTVRIMIPTFHGNRMLKPPNCRKSSPNPNSHHQQPTPLQPPPAALPLHRAAKHSPVQPCAVCSPDSNHAAQSVQQPRPPPPAAPAPDHAAQQPRSPASAPCSQAKACVVCSTAPAVLPHSSLCSPVHSQPACAAQPCTAQSSQPQSSHVLLNGKNFHAWSRSFQLYLSGKRKTRWILGKEPKPAESDPKFDEWVSDNCIILGWMFNSMEDRVNHMFMYHDTVHGLWTALTQMYPHARNESRIFELYRDLSHVSQTSFGLSVADYFGYLQTRWEELAQYEPLSDFPSDGAVFAIVDGDERRRRLLPSPSLPESSPIVPDQRAFAATSGSHLYCQHCHKTSHLIDRCWALHPELKQQFSRPRGGGRGGGRSGGRGRGTPRTGAITEVEPIPAALPDFKQLQLQIAQLQSHLGLATASQSSRPTAAIVAETPTALHAPPVPNLMIRPYVVSSSGIPRCPRGIGVMILPLVIRITRSMSRFLETVPFFSDSIPSPGSGSEILAADELIHPRPLPILEPPLSTPPPNGSLPPIASQDPDPRTQAPLPVSSPESGISPPLVSDIPPPREVVLSMGFQQCHSDHTCFIRRQSQGRCIIISVYVDDIIITGDDVSGIVQVNCGLRKAFDIKDLGPLRYFLGIEVARSRHGISLSQRKYSLDLLQDTGMLGCRPASTPMVPNLKISAESGELLPDPSIYQRLVGRLIYLTNTRPDLTFAVSIVSQFMHSPRTSHLDVVYHILRVITPSFVPSSAQTADMFTKSIGPSLLKSPLVKLGLVDIFASA
ncbi:hypothetical protein Acr_14g0004100 [Actinidia rufa]|uniref:Reverse transcriptase Ty1/copia-type domain-containing protein n=1 Tax=Actinidia rufa TaxID=165716 RepID=A0A7J0FPY1_9ERIC|nr:hypothetical protein Acr_14g0004100 [Actinidia rufa]